MEHVPKGMQHVEQQVAGFGRNGMRTITKAQRTEPLLSLFCGGAAPPPAICWWTARRASFSARRAARLAAFLLVGCSPAAAALLSIPIDAHSVALQMKLVENST